MTRFPLVAKPVGTGDCSMLESIAGPDDGGEEEEDDSNVAMLAAQEMS